MAATEDRTAETIRVVRDYFAEIEQGATDAALRHYAPTATGRIQGMVEGGPPVIAEYFAALHAAFPDFRLEVLEVFGQDDRAAVRWRLRGTFAGPGDFQGFAPTGGRIDITGVDVVRVAEGRIAGIDAYTDGMTVAEQLGLLPAKDSKAGRRMQRARNAGTRLAHRLHGGEPEQVAEGVWVVRGGIPRTMNVYLVRDGEGVMVFDGGIKAMTNAVATAGASLGGITRVVLGHAHPDHRGIAPALGVPVFCHPADKADAEGDGGVHYFDYSKLDLPARVTMPKMLKGWDGGPVTIDGTVEEGDEVAPGWRVVHLPGHAPGLIGIFRESDRLALVSDCFYTLDPQTGRKGHARVPHDAFNHDTEQARASIRKLAALEPSVAWTGHAEPVAGNVRATLEEAAATT